MSRSKKRINLATPRMLGNELRYVQEAFESGWITPLGPFVTRFENDVCEYVGAKSAVALSSGTAAIHLALREAGIMKNDIVFCPSMTFAASANPIVYEGATPVFIDSEKDTFNMSPVALRKAFEKYKAKAVVLVHLYGTPAHMDEIVAICKENGAALIEDATEALGATYKGKMAGTFGDYGTYSFNGNKMITTAGGGMIVSNHRESAEHARFASMQAKEPCRYYYHKEIGFNYRMSNICAAIGVGQLEKIDELLSIKKRIFDRYNASIDAKYAKMLEYYGQRKPNYWLSVMMLDDDAPVTAEEVIDELARNNIDARHVWYPLHKQPIYEGCDFVKEVDGEESNAEYLLRCGICLPSDTNMSEEEQDTVISVINSYIDKMNWLLRHQGY